MGLLFNLHSFGSSSHRATNTHTPLNERSRSSPPTEHMEMTRYGKKKKKNHRFPRLLHKSDFLEETFSVI